MIPLNELLSLKKRLKFKQKEFFMEPKQDGRLVEQLFYYLEENEMDKANLIDTLYPFKKNGQKSFRFIEIELFKKLSKFVLVVNPKNFTKSEYVGASIEVLRNAFIARTLLSLNFRKSGVYIAVRTFKQALNLEIWDVVLSLGTILSHYYALRFEERKSNYYDGWIMKSIDLIRATRVIGSLIDKWSIHFGKKKKLTKEKILELEKDVQRSKELATSQRFSNLMHLRCRMELFYYDAIRDYESALQVCLKASSEFDENIKMLDRNRLGIYKGTEMYCYLNLKKFEEAKGLAFNIENYFDRGGFNWFISMEYYMVLSLQTENYMHAYELINKVTASSNYQALKGPRQQVWFLLEGYMQFVINSGLWKHKPAEIKEKPFHIARFVNKVEKLDFDKTGINVSILILQILFLLNEGRFDELFSRRDPIKRYIYRHLYSKENERSRIFLTLLLRIIECEFVYSEVVRSTKRLLNSMRNQEMNYSALLGGNEIIDYDLLWVWALRSMRNNWSKLPS